MITLYCVFMCGLFIFGFMLSLAGLSVVKMLGFVSLVATMVSLGGALDRLIRLTLEGGESPAVTRAKAVSDTLSLIPARISVACILAAIVYSVLFMFGIVV